jgi:hypothetical protein
MSYIYGSQIHINFVTSQNAQQSLMNNRDGKIKTGMLGTLKVKETMNVVHTYILESLSMH